MMVDSILDVDDRRYYVAQPIYNCQNQMFAVELLARYKNKGVNSEKRIQKMTPSEKQTLLIEQLECISQKQSYFVDHDMLVTVDIDFVMAVFLLQDRYAGYLLDNLPFIHLKINEIFPNLNDGIHNPLLAKLYERHPLWLDDLGRGDANLYAVLQSMFSYIKLDKKFYSAMMKSRQEHIFPALIKNMKKFCNGIIVEGVQDYSEYEYLKQCGVDGMQGHIYPTYLFDKLSVLPT
ncbi:MULTISPECIES: EAL domain-containing protein [unclassified Brenneria]|uniref:EAL domain-containing protein n=1 Tax=unclassified Brenneria TaxID=2634434 RepID=UPI0020A6C2AC|nr:EAL domain-containing protein [Brenneria sp. hezel4-2-4]MEE3651140.1 EAL domain-containing protein [Brenneria sp. HEZEL_4_2_4]